MKYLPYILTTITAVTVTTIFFAKESQFEYETQTKNQEEAEVLDDQKESSNESEVFDDEIETNVTDEEVTEEEKDSEVKDGTNVEENLKDIVYSFLGKPYKRGPLGESPNDKIYRTDVFDCTTLILVSISKYNSNGKSPEEMMGVANYYPAGDISYESRLHFTTYRNLVSPLFEDITKEIGGDLTEEKRVILNREKNNAGRLIDIDWEEEVLIRYIKSEDLHRIKNNIPAEVGVAFIVDGDEDMGLDVRHEGFVFDSNELIHASSQKGEVYKKDFLKFIENNNYSGVLFFNFPK